MELNGSDAGTEGFRILYGDTLLRERSTSLQKTQEQHRNEMQWLFARQHPAYQTALANTRDAPGDPCNTWNPLGLGILCQSKGMQRWCIPQRFSPPHVVCRGESPGAIENLVTSLTKGGSHKPIAGNLQGNI